MQLGDLSQIILYVNDMQQQVEFYRDTLGLKINFPIQKDYSEESWVSFNTGKCTFALHSGGEGRYGEDAPKFTFTIEDVDMSMTQLNEKGVTIGKKVEAYPGSFVISVKDPEGHTFFLQSHP